ncbi:MAG: RHS repeat protein [Saprospiraceae bacterium]|nr:RHS repeat protein [Saprospiraceae bacterium]
MPISLSYNSSGIRVDEVASAVGLGWSLNAGGVVTRTVRGLPDEDPNGWLNTGPITEVLGSAVLQKSALRGELDTEADEFFYNFLGYTGKFVIEKGGEVRTIPYNNLKIIPNEYLDQFIIQTPDGSVFLFANLESGTNETYCDLSHDEPHFPVTSSWYLTEYQNPAQTNEIIKFKYKSSETTYISNYSAEAYGRPLILQTYQGPKQHCNFNCSKPLDDQCVNIARTQTLYLDSIITAVGHVVFQHRQRTDINGGLSYDTLLVYGAADQLLQRITLNHSYFHCPGRSFDETLKYTFDSTDTHFRLKLNSVIIEGQPDGELTYDLQYYEDQSLPPRLSLAKDYWGFYNGRTSNISLLPSIPNQLNDNFAVKLADRRPVKEFIKTGMLKKIEFPTGGSQSFEYEAHDSKSDPDSVEQFVAKSQFIGHLFDSDPAIETFSICNLEGTAVYDLEIDYTWTLNVPDEILVDILVGKTSHSIYINPDQGDGSATARISFFIDTCIDITVRSYGLTNSLSIDRLRYSVKENVLIDEGIAQVGGARIREIVTDDKEGNTLHRTFKYVDESGNSSGNLNFRPIFDGIRGTNFLCVAPETGPLLLDCYWAWKSSSSAIPLGEYNGSHIFYERVEEFYNEGSLGKGVFEYNVVFSTQADLTGFQIDDLDDTYVNAALVGKPLNNENWKSGFLMHEAHYQNNLLINEKEYHYTFDISPTNGNKTIECLGVPISPSTVLLKEGSFPHVFYKTYSNWFTLDTVIERFYDDAGSNFVEKVTTNVYDPDNLMQISSSFVNCDGAVYTDNTVYEQIGDFDQTPGEYVILNKETTTKKGSQIITGAQYTYPSSGPLRLPVTIHNYEGSFGWDLYGTYGAYSSDGYPATFTKANYPPVVYTWSNGLLFDQVFADFTWHFGYDDNHRKLDSLIQVDGQVITYSYDGLQRLKTMTERAGKRVTSHAYTLGGPNFITTSTSYDDAPTRTIEKHFDGLGRYLRTNSIAYDPQGGGDVITDGGSLDPLGRMIKQVFLPDTYQTNTYEGSPHGRILETRFPDGATIQQGYPYTNYFVTQVIDENDHPTTTTTDLVAKPHQVKNAINGITAYYYNGFDNIDSITTPEMNMYSYGYDSKQRLVSKSVPGGGPVTFIYNDRDLIETTTDANSKVIQKYYDVHNRDSIVTIDGKSIVYDYDKDRLTDKGAQSFGGVTLTDEYIYDVYGRIMTQNSTTIAGEDAYDFSYLHSDLTITNNRERSDVILNQNFSYDNWGRPVNHDLGISNGPSATIQANTWNKRDELIAKGLFGETGKLLQAQKFMYHIRGWLTDINKVESGIDLTQLMACDAIPPGDSIPDFLAIMKKKLIPPFRFKTF